MKKRCTNSACRKLFVVDDICPHCGKKYPRLPSAGHDVVLVESGEEKMWLIWTLRKLNGKLSLKECKKMMESCPCVIASGLSRKETLRWCREIHKTGAVAKIQ